jgi:single-stranded-DNA-specific exonuclease recJ
MKNHFTGNPLIDVALMNRGVKSIDEIDYKLNKILPINSLTFIQDVAKEILNAIEQNKRIVVIADYDCDGVTAGTVMIRMLKALKANVAWLIPDRSIHGYGLTPEIVDFAHDGWVNGSVETQAQLESQIKQNILQYVSDYANETNKFRFSTSEQIIATSTHYIKTMKPDVIITVDNGIASVAGVERANELGLSVIVTDHHLAGDKLPNAKVIVNPNHPQCDFKSKALCGVGVAWYVCAAISQELTKQNKQVPIKVVSLLPYVALGTVADVVTLDFNNRTLVANGLKVLKDNLGLYKGINNILKVANIDIEKITTSNIGFQIAPRLNAAGRISHMGIGLMNLLTEDETIAYLTAHQLNYLNEERKRLTAEVQTEAVDALFNEFEDKIDKDNFVLVAYPKEDREWHEGVVGIVAGRLKETYNKPSIALTYVDGFYKGSCRSIPCLNMKELLDDVACKDPTILVKFGGHAMAAGLTLYADKLDDFIRIINEIAKTRLKESDFDKVIYVDYVPRSKDLTIPNIEELNQAIWGQNFVEPIFSGKITIRETRRIGANLNHLKLKVSLDGYTYNAVCFNCEDWEPDIDDELTVLYSLGVNEWRGVKNVDLLIKHYDLSKLTIKHY